MSVIGSRCCGCSLRLNVGPTTNRNARGLQVQCTIGRSDYAARDGALKALIQPLAGEYGMHNGEAQGAGSPPGLLHAFISLPGVGCSADMKLNCIVIQQ